LPHRQPRWWRTTIATAAAITTLLGAGVVWRYVTTPPGQQALAAAPVRLAVLPFRALGANADGDALCAGLAEILTNRLRQIEYLQGSLHVISAADVANEHVSSARDARSAFGATLAVTGSIQWSGDKVLVAANLVDTATQLVVEARDFEASPSDIPGLGRLLVQKVAGMLELSVRPESQADTGNVLENPSPASALYLLGRGYLQRFDRVENLDHALESFDGALRLDPAFALAHAGKAEAWLRRDRIIRDPSALQQARASSQRALELAPNLAQANLTAALVHLAGGEHAKAIESLQRALQIEPANADAMRELGNAYDASGRTAEAEATFKEAVRLRPESWAAIRDLGVYYNRHGRLPDALTSFQRVVAIAPDSYASYGNLGGIYLRLGMHGEAAAALQKSLALRPTSKAYMNLGTVRYFEGRFREAADAYREAAQLTPSDERAWGALADALRWVPGNSDEVVGAYRQAIALAERQVSVNPHDSELRSRLAMYHAYAGDRDAADKELAEAVRLRPHDGTVLFRAALIHEQFGRRNRALRAIEEALRDGYSREEIGKAPALESLRQDPKYARIAASTAASLSQQSGK
jgi:serine/threonine-protein kinase